MKEKINFEFKLLYSDGNVFKSKKFVTDKISWHDLIEFADSKLE